MSWIIFPCTCARPTNIFQNTSNLHPVAKGKTTNIFQQKWMSEIGTIKSLTHVYPLACSSSFSWSITAFELGGEGRCSCSMNESFKENASVALAKSVFCSYLNQYLSKQDDQGHK
jgi:hypothetical protein